MRHHLSTLWAGILAAGLVTASSASAVTIEQTQSFNQFQSVLSTRPLEVDTMESTLGFAAFDPALGVLRGATWRLTSDNDYSTGLAVLSGFAVMNGSSAFSQVLFQGASLGTADRDLRAPFGCGDPCLAAVNITGPFDFEVAAGDLDPFLGPRALEAVLRSTIGFNATFLEGTVGQASGVLEWAGDLSLIYEYDRVAIPSIPEPGAWTLMIGGFAMTGAVLRGRVAARKRAG